MMTIDSIGAITLDGKNTGLGVKQTAAQTVVYSRPRIDATVAYQSHAMPCARYSLATDAPASGVPGRAAFERDVRAMIEDAAT
jgi:hypothetical protein